jgi:hypothetical protein
MTSNQSKESKVNVRVSMRRFLLMRIEDETGMSGTGIVAEGVEMSSGRCLVEFRSHISSSTLYDSIKAVKEIHGHTDAKTTRIKWLDPDPNAEDETSEKE